jgi:hypothetical protein
MIYAVTLSSRSDPVVLAKVIGVLLPTSPSVVAL